MLSMPLLSAAALGAVHRVLTVVSQPMNRVPDQWRTGVNIIAVTLALWAPLAWILPGMLHQWRTNAARHAATQATLHAESGHATTPPHDTQGASSDHHAAAAGSRGLRRSLVGGRRHPDDGLEVAREVRLVAVAELCRQHGVIAAAGCQALRRFM